LLWQPSVGAAKMEVQQTALRCRSRQDHRGVRATTALKMCLGELSIVCAALRVIPVRHVGVAEEDDRNEQNRKKRRSAEGEGDDADL
jgi:hypothetical protein